MISCLNCAGAGRGGVRCGKNTCAYLYVRRRDNRIKMLVHDGLKIWLATRRLNLGRFFGPGVRHGKLDNLDAEQLQAFVLDSP
jgi:transposase